MTELENNQFFIENRSTISLEKNTKGYNWGIKLRQEKDETDDALLQRIICLNEKVKLYVNNQKEVKND
jgi:hypothetical protein